MSDDLFLLPKSHMQQIMDAARKIHREHENLTRKVEVRERCKVGMYGAIAAFIVGFLLHGEMQALFMTFGLIGAIACAFGAYGGAKEQYQKFDDYRENLNNQLPDFVEISSTGHFVDLYVDGKPITLDPLDVSSYGDT